MSLIKVLKRSVRIATSPLALGSKRAMLRAEFGRSRNDISVPVGSTSVTLAGDTLRIDYYTLYGALIDRHFDFDVADAVVLDVGAHKGYFAARCLSDGASQVISFEPASQNLSYLRAAALEESRWEVRPEAVGASDGSATLNLAPGSWGHSFQTPVGGETTGTEVVPVTALSTVIQQCGAERRLVVKINVEGAAGEMILGTSESDWRQVQSLWVDVETNDPAGFDAISDHLVSCGYEHVQRDGQRHRFDNVS